MDDRFALHAVASPVPDADRAKMLRAPGFGKISTDHMLVMRWSPETGWAEGRIEARGPLSIDPSCAALHYAQEIFEGMKAYRLPDGGIALFRPEMNARRFAASARRMAMEPMPEDLFVSAVEALVRAERGWIPAIGEGSLYLRPFMIASEAFLGVRPAAEYLFCIIASPAGAYFKRADAGLTLWLSETYIRAAPGGTGEAKCAGNYAASLLAQSEAIAQGCDQVLFLDAIERRWVEELGGMNIFFVFDDGSLATPPLTGTILPGITRDSIIAIARDLGHEVREEPYAIGRWEADAASGRLVEVFACGTAAVVAPVGRVRGRSRDILVSAGRPGPVAETIRSALVAIQHGQAPDPHGWLHRIA